MHRLIRLSILFALVATWSANAFGSTVDLLDFSEWNVDVLSTDGGEQHFENVSDNLDVTVTAFGEFDADSRFITTLDGGTDAISTQHNPSSESQCHGYVFQFSRATDIVIETESLDGQEEYLISSDGAVSYTNVSGASPSVTSATSNVLHLDGIAFGRDPLTGSSDGIAFIDAPDGDGAFSVSVSYCADPTLGGSNITKYGSFRVSAVSSAVTQLPEPGAFSLFGLGGLALLVLRRKRA